MPRRQLVHSGGHAGEGAGARAGEGAVRRAARRRAAALESAKASTVGGLGGGRGRVGRLLWRGRVVLKHNTGTAADDDNVILPVEPIPR